MSLSMDKKCCVPNCGKTRLDGSILHSFPNYEKDPDRFRTWIYAIGGELLSLENKTIHKYRRVCHDHFSPRYHTPSKRLCANAVPTLNLPGFSVRRESLQEMNNVNVEVNKVVESCHITPSGSNSGFSVRRESLQEINNVNVEVNKAVESCQITSSGSESVASLEIVKPAVTTIMTINKTMAKDSRNIKRLIPSLAQKFSDETSLLRRKIIRLQTSNKTFAKKLKMAMNLEENPTFQKSLRNFNSAARKLLTLQLKQSSKGKFGRRYSREEKILSLAFYKMGPRAYRWFRNILILPAPVTLSRMISNADIKPGFNECIFSSLKKRVQQMSDSEKLCVLLFDEMALSPHFDFNKKKDLIRGFVDNGKEAQKKIADHVLVFMVRGIVKNYKQAIYYTFCSGSTPNTELKSQIVEVIMNLQASGINVVATICDQGASNVSAIKQLVKDTRSDLLRNGQESRHNIFIINGKEIVPLFDTPHLLKGIRNNMLNKHIKCNLNGKVCIGKWEHIIALYNADPGYNNLKFLPKLTENHVLPAKIKKMKVKFASQVFSASVGIHMGYLSSHKILPEDYQQTADIILFFDSLFDSLNGSYGNVKKNQNKPLLRPVTRTSSHGEEWAKAIRVLKSMQFIDINNKSLVVPSITNWIWTLENLQFLSVKLLTGYNLKAFWMRHFNQDPLENFFGSIRSHGVRNTNPTCAGFEIAFASVLVNNLCSHSRGSNCEEDKAQNMLLKSMKKIFFQKQKVLNCSPVEIDFEDVSEPILVGLQNKNITKVVNLLHYVAGFVIRKARVNVFKNCSFCKSILISENESQYVVLKERDTNKKSLTYPSQQATEMFSDNQDVVSHIIKKKSHIYNIKKYIKTVISVHCDFNFISCGKHKEQIIKYIEDLACNFLISNWCKITNKVMAGVRSDIDVEDTVQIACSMYNKRKK